MSGCSVPTPDPAKVLTKTTFSLANLSGFNYHLDLDLVGSLGNSLATPIKHAHFQLAGTSEDKPQAVPQFTLDANITADSATGPIQLAGNVIGLADYTYFRLTNLKFPTLSPIAVSANSHWYKIQSTPDTLVDPGKRLGASTSPPLVTAQQIVDIRKAVADESLFQVTQTFPDTTLAGHRNYHYQVALNPEDLPRMAAVIAKDLNLSAPTAAQISAWEKYSAEIWIDKSTYNLTQLKISGTSPGKAGNIVFAALLNLDHPNQPAKISAPTNTEELSPASLRSLLPTF